MLNYKKIGQVILSILEKVSKNIYLNFPWNNSELDTSSPPLSKFKKWTSFLRSKTIWKVPINCFSLVKKTHANFKRPSRYFESLKFLPKCFFFSKLSPWLPQPANHVSVFWGIYFSHNYLPLKRYYHLGKLVLGICTNLFCKANIQGCCIHSNKFNNNFHEWKFLGTATPEIYELV